MTDPRQSAEELFGEALELPPESRSAFLDRACGHDPELRRLLEQLLLEDARAGSFLAHPAFTPDGTGNPSAPGPAPIPGRFQSGQLIADRFAIVRFIARGGMGEVYEAKDQFLQDSGVALKIIRPEIAADATTSTRFEQEVLLARKVVHANLCPIYEIFRCDQPAPPFLFLTMRLLQGETLYARFEQSKKMETGEAVDICKQLLAGVAALHAGGVIHRDLKPNNVMLETGGSGSACQHHGFWPCPPARGCKHLVWIRPHRRNTWLHGARTIAWRAADEGHRPLRSGRGAAPGADRGTPA